MYEKQRGCKGLLRTEIKFFDYYLRRNLNRKKFLHEIIPLFSVWLHNDHTQALRVIDEPVMGCDLR